MSYNLLADSHAWKYRNELYRGIHDSILSWRRRLRGIVQEVKALRPTFSACRRRYFTASPRFGGCGYTGLHAPRAGGRTDGSSVFQDLRFPMRSLEAVDFTDFDLRITAAVACLVPADRTRSR